MPGFIDLHVHFRDPGLIEKETINHEQFLAFMNGTDTEAAKEENQKAKEQQPLHMMQWQEMRHTTRQNFLHR